MSPPVPIWYHETAVDADAWWEAMRAHPSTGHCAVAALLINTVAGGRILRVEMAGGGTHYYNELPDGSIVDLTRDQFDPYNPVGEPAERTRSQLLDNDDTRHRFRLFIERISRWSEHEISLAAMYVRFPIRDGR